MHASNFLRDSSSLQPLAPDVVAEEVTTDFFRVARRIGRFTDFGTSVLPK